MVHPKSTGEGKNFLSKAPVDVRASLHDNFSDGELPFS